MYCYIINILYYYALFDCYVHSYLDVVVSEVLYNMTI